MVDFLVLEANSNSCDALMNMSQVTSPDIHKQNITFPKHISKAFVDMHCIIACPTKDNAFSAFFP